jgi:enoyl-CoA hydratase/carnithine racemase
MLRKAVQSASRLTGVLHATASLCHVRTFAVSASPRFVSKPDAPILTRLEDNVLTVTFNRPATYNAMTVEMGERFEEIMSQVHFSLNDASDDQVKAVVVTGAGKAFSSGGDLQYLLDRSEDSATNNFVEMQRFYRRFLSVRKSPGTSGAPPLRRTFSLGWALQTEVLSDVGMLPSHRVSFLSLMSPSLPPFIFGASLVPTIAAINGPCVGAGACFAIACDVRILSSSTYIGFTFSKLALHPGLAATHFLPRIVGPQAANKFLLTGDMVYAAEAKETGLVAAVVEPSELTAAAEDMARKMVATSCLAQQTLLQTLRWQQDEGLDRALIREADMQARTYSDPVFKANVLAIKNKK